MQNISSTLEAPKGEIYVAVIRELPGFRFYVNAYGEPTKYPASAAQFDSPESAMEAARNGAYSQFKADAGYALFNQNRDAMSGEPMVLETQR